ncbi:MAG: hypothetical protein AAB368_12980, partial [bacterium]
MGIRFPRSVLHFAALLTCASAQADVILHSFEPSASIYDWAAKNPTVCALPAACASNGPCASLTMDSSTAIEGSSSGLAWVKGSDCVGTGCTPFRTITLSNFSPKDWSAGFTALWISARAGAVGSGVTIRMRVRDTSSTNVAFSTLLVNLSGTWQNLGISTTTMSAAGVNLSSIGLVALDFGVPVGCGTVFLDALRLELPTECTAPPPLGLTVSKEQVPAEPGLGEPVTWRIVVANTGGATVTSLVVTDTAPWPVTGLAADQPPGVSPPGIISAPLTGTRFVWSWTETTTGLPPGGRFTFTITGRGGLACAGTSVANEAR